MRAYAIFWAVNVQLTCPGADRERTRSLHVELAGNLDHIDVSGSQGTTFGMANQGVQISVDRRDASGEMQAIPPGLTDVTEDSGRHRFK